MSFSRPDDPSYNHQYAHINGIRMHFIDVGPRDGLPLVLVHGFPDLWWGWRNQIHALRDTYRVIVADNRGFGETDSPPARDSYGRKTIAQDYASLLDHLKIDRAVFIGHDWGADFVWKMSLFHPTRVVAVAAFCSPYFPRTPACVPLDALVRVLPSLEYQLFFNEPETPAILTANVEAFLCLMYGDRVVKGHDGFPDRLRAVHDLQFEYPRPPLLSPVDFDFYVAQYRRTTLTGPLNWYKVLDLDWADEANAPVEIQHEALFVAAGKDIALPVHASDAMVQVVPHLTRKVIDGASHWILWDSPDQVNSILCEWLATVAVKYKMGV
ncbi:Aste57867_8652 [Aphanomyces stellatus]|uniref:Aste57867_8652 protein n=1 Tax=Aphanomyces stellatus TaxID=120398 RepID=A0A485KKV0_9STRA|nr:hypothetical protein As57867_008618 [Aphanomyces stellatus]VFT85538.1 Aste57867_8652 [Aphanomyces stellatus]